MILRDHTIRRMVNSRELVVAPYIDENVQPATIDLTLSHHFKVMVKRGIPIDPFDLHADSLYEDVTVPFGGTFGLEPGMFVLGSTVERFEFPAGIAGRLEGKSSLARIGIVVHSTAGFFDPGFKGTATLEFTSSALDQVLLWPGMKIAHMSFHMLDGDAVVPYGDERIGSKYQDQEGATESRYDQNVRATA